MTKGNDQLTADGEDVGTLKAELQEQRRTATLLRAQLHEATEASEDLKAELEQARSDVAANRTRRKELEGMVADLQDQLRMRFEELAALQRQLIRTNYVWRVKGVVRKVKQTIGRA